MSEPHVDAEKSGLITVVIPARNEEGFIGTCLASVRRQTYPDLEILVIDSESTDGTVAVVQQHAREDPRVRLLSEPRLSIPAALNAGLAAARGPWLVRVDAHSTVPPEYVETLVRHLQTGRWGGVGGRKEAVGVTTAGRAIAAVMGSRFGVGNSWYHHATTTRTVEHIPFGAYPTDLLRALGGWDERIAANEDFELDYRLRTLGHALLLDPTVAIEWSSRQSIGDFFRQYRRYGRGKAAVAALHPRSLLPRHLMPPALVAATTLAIGVGAYRPRVGAAIVAPYVVALAAASAVVARKLPTWRVRGYVPIAFVAMHYGWGIGLLEETLRHLMRAGRRSAKRRRSVA